MKFVGWLLLVVFCSASFTLRAGTPLKVEGDWHYPPDEFLDANGEPTGFNVELFKAVAEATGLNYHIHPGPWNEVRTHLESGEIDVITGMYFSEERSKVVSFSIPHTIVSHTIFVHSSSRAHSLDDLRNSRIIIQQDDIMNDIILSKNITEKVMEAENQDHPGSR